MSFSERIDWGKPVTENWDGEELKATIRFQPDRIQNIKDIATFITENCPRLEGCPEDFVPTEEQLLLHKLEGYGQQLLISIKDVEDKMQEIFESAERGWAGVRRLVK